MSLFEQRLREGEKTHLDGSTSTFMVHEETVEVELPERIVSRVDDRLPRTEFRDSGEYITFVLEEVLYRVEEETKDDDFEPVDEQEVEQRLKSLGYLNE